MPWLKYRHQSSASYGTWEWEWLGPHRPTRADLREMIEEMAESRSWSEHYRGIQYTITQNAPEEIVAKERQRAKVRAHSARLTFQELTAELARVKARRPQPSPRSSGTRSASRSRSRPRSSGKKTKRLATGTRRRARSA